MEAGDNQSLKNDETGNSNPRASCSQAKILTNTAPLLLTRDNTGSQKASLDGSTFIPNVTIGIRKHNWTDQNTDSMSLLESENIIRQT